MHVLLLRVLLLRRRMLLLLQELVLLLLQELVLHLVVLRHELRRELLLVVGLVRAVVLGVNWPRGDAKTHTKSRRRGEEKERTVEEERVREA